MEYFNFLLFSSLLYYLIKKKKSIFAIYIVAIWSVSAFVGVFYVNLSTYREGLNPVTLAPFIYLFVCVWLLVRPFVNNDGREYDFSVLNSRYVDYLSFFIIAVTVFPFFEYIYHLGVLIISGQFLLLGANYGDEEASLIFSSLIPVSHLGLKLRNYALLFTTVSPLLLFHYMNQRKSALVLGMAMNVLLSPISNIAVGSRTQTIFTLLFFIGLVLVFKTSIYQDSYSKLKKYILVVSGFVAAIFIAMSIGRYVLGGGNKNEDVSGFLYQYSAESMYNFNQNAFHETQPLWGYASSEPLLYYLGVSKINHGKDVDIWERRNYMNSIIKSPSHLFYSLIGDFYLDIGPILTLFLILILGIIMNNVLKKEFQDISSLFFMCIYINMLCNSLFYFCYKIQWTTLLCTLFLCLLFKFLPKKGYKNNSL